MAEETGISWVDSTFNPFWGCTKVSPACDHCYAEAMDKRTGGNHWGTGSRPRTMSEKNWYNPIRWERKADEFFAQHGRNRRVFSGSMCDVFDKNAPEGQHDRLFKTIKVTPRLEWLLLTKRAPNIEKMLPADWGNGYANVWLGVSVEDIKHGKPRIDILRNIPAKCRFLSCEPLLEDLGELDLSGIHWVIVGGESGSHARPMKEEWMLNIKQQCDAAGVPFFFKQWGGSTSDAGGCIFNEMEIKHWPALEYFGITAQSLSFLNEVR